MDKMSMFKGVEGTRRTKEDEGDEAFAPSTLPRFDPSTLRPLRPKQIVQSERNKYH